VKLLAFQDNSACGFYRIIQPLGQFERHSHQTRIVHGNADPDPDTDIIVGERLDRPEAQPTWRRWRAKHRLVYEIDDDVWSVDEANWLAWKVYKHEIPRDVTVHMAETADLVTCSTAVLAEQVRRQTSHRNILVLPNYVDEALLRLERIRRDHLTVGWAGGASHARDLAWAGPQLRRFLQRNPHARMHVIGTDFREFIGPGVQWTDWADDVWGYYRLIDFDIGVIPVWDNAFGRSKSHIKALEYAALGIPVIASDLEPYREFVLDGVTGFLVRHEHQWGRRLYELANDAAMREEMGAKARQHAAAFTIQGNWRKWEAAYASIL
jgi:glycosyltransferase involved in cell wall biosynthesis